MVLAPRQLRRDGFTVEDVLALPEDGLRRELFDGMMIVNPSPIVAHQVVVLAVIDLLRQNQPAAMRVLPGPIDWAVSENRLFVPDVVVLVDDVAITSQPRLGAPPALVVEVSSPSTRTFDRHQKFQAYDAAGAGAYWIVDPDPQRPSVVVYERAGGGGLVEATQVEGPAVAQASHPWPIEITPADLIR